MERARRHADKRGRNARGLLVLALLLVACLSPAKAAGTGTSQREEGKARVFTDGHLRPGHMETIRVTGFAGRGSTEVDFFPTAICGSECAAAARLGARTSDGGAAKFSVRMPGTFVDQHGKHVFFRDGERIELEVLWSGAGKAFDVADATPEPIIERTHGTHG
jgi:hypothetical protein